VCPIGKPAGGCSSGRVPPVETRELPDVIWLAGDPPFLLPKKSHSGSSGVPILLPFFLGEGGRAAIASTAKAARRYAHWGIVRLRM